MLDSALLPLRSAQAGLRPLRASDAEAYAAGTEDPGVRENAHLPESRYTPDSVRAALESTLGPGLARGDLAVLAIEEPGTGAFAGSLVIFDVAGDSAEVGFWVSPEHRGRGLAVAALGCAARFARASGLRQLRARTLTANTAAQRVLSAAGFAATGHARGRTPAGASAELLGYRRELGRPEVSLTTPRLTLRPHRTARPTPRRWAASTASPRWRATCWRSRGRRRMRGSASRSGFRGLTWTSTPDRSPWSSSAPGG